MGLLLFYSINWANFRRNTMQWNIFLLLVTAVRCIFLFSPFFLWLLLLWHCCTMKKNQSIWSRDYRNLRKFYSLSDKKKKKKKERPSPRKLLLTRNNPFIWYKACLPVLVAIPSISQRNKVQRWNLEKQTGKCTRPNSLQKHDPKAKGDCGTPASILIQKSWLQEYFLCDILN